MPEPTERGRRYVPGLDGLRALAVLCVIAYHLGFSWAGGGMLGVGIFFTLSGYLITDLLLGHWKRHGELGLRTFWVRRARRLLPALFLMLAVASVLVALVDPEWLGALRRQVISATFYFANWSTIAQHGSYFARFAPPLPLDHLWSLSIEEQFYLVWPLVLLGGIWLMRGRARLALATLALAAGSLVAMALLHHPGYDPTRVYEGTDTRAFGLLIGAALAMVWPSQTPRAAARPRVRRALDVAGVAGLLGALVLVWRTDPVSSFLYPYGFVLLSLATAVTLAAIVNPASRLGAALGWRPLRWIGVRSYGIYLWQWPIIVLITPVGAGFSWGRGVLAVAATMAAAALSWRFVEQPIRRGGLVRLRHRLTSAASTVIVRRRMVALSGTAMAVLLLPALGLIGALPAVSSAGASGPLVKALPHPLAARAGRVPGADPPRVPAHPATASQPAGAATAQPAPPAPAPLATPAAGGGAGTWSSCRSVVYIGDSTSEGEVSTDYIPNPRLRLQSQLARVGVRTTYPEISGARSTVETFKGHPNAATVAKDHLQAGYRGCWILAMGTNDVANVHEGGRPGLAGRIARMMAVIGSQPVLWVDLITLQAPGRPYSEDTMQQWNSDLLAACARYPNMRVFDWAARARRKWFIPDGIHYYSPGYVARTHLIAGALADAFPAHGSPSPSCLVG
ncbi:MAG: acyltransferase family protein [Solirubrobacteraceae bacterium]